MLRKFTKTEKGSSPNISNISISNINVAEKINVDATAGQKIDETANDAENVVALQLRKFLQHVNNHSNKKADVFLLSQLVGDKDPNQLARYFKGEELPSFTYIEKFCLTFSLNPEWI